MHYTKKLALFIFLFFCLPTFLLATPQFAKENHLGCSTCHSSVPSLNDMGRLFLRNGFRFSPQDETTLKKFLDDFKTKKVISKHENKTTVKKLFKQKDNNSSYYIPLAVTLGAKYNSIVSNDSKTSFDYKIFSAGTLTSNLSYFFSYSNEKHREYLQYNIDNNKIVLRVGKLSPFTQLTSINRLSAGSALRGNNARDDSTKDQNQGYGKNSGKENSNILARYGKPSTAPDQSETADAFSNNKNTQDHPQGESNRNTPYKDPIQNSYFREYYGLEYSYQYKYNTIIMFGFGKTTNNSTDKKKDSKSSNNAENDLDPDSSDKNQFVFGIRHTTQKRYDIGLMIDKIPDSTKTNYSVLAFMEKNIKKFYIYLSLVYKNGKGATNDYYGNENGIVYQIDNTSSMKTVLNFDKDEYKYYNRGFLVSYNKMYKKVSFELSIARRETKTKEQNILQLSTKVYF